MKRERERKENGGENAKSFLEVRDDVEREVERVEEEKWNGTKIGLFWFLEEKKLSITLFKSFDRGSNRSNNGFLLLTNLPKLNACSFNGSASLHGLAQFQTAKLSISATHNDFQ